MDRVIDKGKRSSKLDMVFDNMTDVVAKLTSDVLPDGEENKDTG